MGRRCAQIRDIDIGRAREAQVEAIARKLRRNVCIAAIEAEDEARVLRLRADGDRSGR